MSKLQVMSLENLQEFKTLHDTEIAKKIEVASNKAIKCVSISTDGYTIYFYKTTNPASVNEAAYSITLPSPVDITGKADKVNGAVSGHFAGLDSYGNLIDSGKKASDFEKAGASAQAQEEIMQYVGDIPNTSTASTVIDYIKELIDSSGYDDAALLAKINLNKAAIDVLNGTGEGSVKQTVSTAIAEVVAEAPESLDTLKEIADWLTEHATDAADMNSRINTNKEDIAKLKTYIGNLPETTAATTIVDWVAEYVSQALRDSELEQYASADELKAALVRISNVEKNVATNATAIDNIKDTMGEIPTNATSTTIIDYIGEATGKVKTEITGNINDLSSRLATAETNVTTNRTNIASNSADIATNKKNIETNTINIATNKANISSNASNIAKNTIAIEKNTTNIAANTSSIQTNTTNILALQELVGDGFEAISSADIQALFATS